MAVIAAACASPPYNARMNGGMSETPSAAVEDAAQRAYRAARAAMAAGDPDAALRQCAHALALAPCFADALLLQAALQRSAGALAQARRSMDAAVDASHRHPVALANRAGLRLQQGDPAGAAADASQAAAKDPALFGAWFNLGEATWRMNAMADAEIAFARAHSLRPADGAAALALSRALQAQARDVESVPLLEGLLQREPDHALGRLLLANALANSARAEQANVHYAELLQRHPDFAQAHSTWLVAQQNDPRVTPGQLLERHCAWSRQHGPVAAEPYVTQRHGDRPHASRPAGARLPDTHEPRTDTPLRIGWVSPRFDEGPVATFFLQVLRSLDRRTCTNLLYSGTSSRSAAAEAFRAAADQWIPTEELSDGALVQRLRADRLDVLVDLSGHAPAHRLRAFAARCAPLQVSWLDYFCTTGVPAMDVLLSDAWLTPPGSERFFVEKVLHLPQGRLCYSPPEGCPRPGPVGTGPLVLACFNRLNKFHPALLELWRGVLERLPQARLRLKSAAFNHASGRAWWTQVFGQHGVPVERIELCPSGSHLQTMQAYRGVDIALDTWPFNGCATTADALWMGVPVVTLAGSTMVSRQSGALLQRVGLEQCIATDAEGYIAATVDLARDQAARRKLRTELRARMQQAHDPVRFAAQLQQLLHDAVRPGTAG